MNLIGIGSRAAWRDQAREDHTLIQAALLILQTSPDNLADAISGLERTVIEGSLKQIRATRQRYQEAIATLDAAEERLHERPASTRIDRLAAILADVPARNSDDTRTHSDIRRMTSGR
ncbi:MAG TPA: hypothetical protein VHO91_10825 [Rhodopila sp.]|nr:hypothetical protein [Rhodopila sp.]